MKKVTKKKAMELAKKILGRGAILADDDGTRYLFQTGELLTVEVFLGACEKEKKEFRYFRAPGSQTHYEKEVIYVVLCIGGYGRSYTMYFTYDTLDEILFEYAPEVEE